jgi:hypothetical protein
MATSLPRARATLRIGRCATLGAVATMAIACVPSEPTAPARQPLRPPTAVAADASGQGPQACVPDSKLIGRFAASTADQPGTWWRLTKDRFDALGVTDYKAALEGFYGQSFTTLDDAIDFLIDGVKSWDANGNGYVCAFEVNGTRAWLGVNALYLIGIADDKHVEN